MSHYYAPKRGSSRKSFTDLVALRLNKDSAQLHKLVGREFTPTNPLPFDPDATYALTDGTNWLWVDFTKAGKLSGASRYGGNNVHDLLEACGEMVSAE